MAREVDQRPHEETVVRRARQVLDESAVDLDQIEFETAEILERGVAGAEIVHGDLCAQAPDHADRADGGLDIFDRAGFGQFDGQAAGEFLAAFQGRAQANEEIGIMQGVARHIDRDAHVGVFAKFLQAEIQNALVDQLDQSGFLSRGQDGGRQRHYAVGAA